MQQIVPATQQIVPMTQIQAHQQITPANPILNNGTALVLHNLNLFLANIRYQQYLASMGINTGTFVSRR